ncbi:Kinesin-like protein KIN-14U [Bienertia sinuspersici]
MIVHINTVEENLAETICSMSFAKRVRRIDTNHKLPQILRKKSINEFLDEMRESKQDENNWLFSIANNNEKMKKTTQYTNKEVVDVPRNPTKPTKRKSLPYLMTFTAIC